MKFLLLTIPVLLFSFIEKTSMTYVQRSTEKDFDLWNRSTIQSLKSQLAYTKNSKISNTLKNRLDVIQSSLYAPTEANDKGAPSRYKFLNAINAIRKANKALFVVESEHEGEVLILRNYLIENTSNTSHVMVYSYYRNNWVKVRDTIISRLELKEVLNNKPASVDKLSGLNDSDVIVSEFAPTDISSHYFIPMSIDKDNMIQKILKL